MMVKLAGIPESLLKTRMQERGLDSSVFTTTEIEDSNGGDTAVEDDE